jgi:hypothetical protein
MSFRRCLLGIIVAALAVTSQTVVGQDADSHGPVLPREIIAAPDVLPHAKRQQIDQFVDYWTKELVSAELEEAVPAARVMLEAPVKDPSATKIFKSAYATAVIRKLADAVATDRLMTRLNTMILLRSVAAPLIEKRIRAGLEDENPAVRYLAAMAANAAGGRNENEVADGQKQDILKALTEAFNSEGDPIVAGQMLDGMLGLVDLSEARLELLSSIDARVAIHARNPNLPIDSDARVLKELFRYLLRHDPNISKDLARALTLTGYRLMALSAGVLEGQRADEGMDKQYEDIVLLADDLLRWVLVKKLKVTGPAAELLPNEKAVEKDILDKNYKTVLERVEQWRLALQKTDLFKQNPDALATDFFR